MTDNNNNNKVIPIYMRQGISFTEYIKSFWLGIKSKKNVGNHKWAMQRLSHLSSIIISTTINFIVLFILVFCVNSNDIPEKSYINVSIAKIENISENAETTEKEQSESNKNDETGSETAETTEKEQFGNDSENLIDDVYGIKSELKNDVFSSTINNIDNGESILKIGLSTTKDFPNGINGIKDLYPRGTEKGREKAIKDRKGTVFGESAVIKSLRWLKSKQNKDGSWQNEKQAMTGLALLTYLGHGETHTSKEFGNTVKLAIKYLIDNRDSNGGWKRSYQHEICTYAMCEAYSMTKILELKDIAEKATQIIIDGQNNNGGFDYSLNGLGNKSDTSVMGWAAQALKAAKIAELNVNGLDNSIEKLVKAFKANASINGFGYDGPGNSGLTGTGVLCLQLLGASNSQEVRNGLKSLSGATYNWDGNGIFNKNYYWYYITQAKFHEGGVSWDLWNKLFNVILTKNQTIIRESIKDENGKLVDMGYWEMSKELSGHTDGDVMNTCLSALQLEVYYRILPSYGTIEVVDNIVNGYSDDIGIEINKIH